LRPGAIGRRFLSYFLRVKGRLFDVIVRQRTAADIVVLRRFLYRWLLVLGADLAFLLLGGIARLFLAALRAREPSFSMTSSSSSLVRASGVSFCDRGMWYSLLQWKPR
jgi:hypothetical protein